MRQQRLPAISRISDSQRHARKGSDQRRLKRIGKQDCQIEVALAPLAHLLDNRAQTTAFMNLQIIEKVGVGKKSFSPGARGQRDMRVREIAAATVAEQG